MRLAGLGRGALPLIDEFHLNRRESWRRETAPVPPLDLVGEQGQEDAGVSTARGLGISRRQLRNRIAELRVRFAAAGFETF